jgi:hypothetical protein
MGPEKIANFTALLAAVNVSLFYQPFLIPIAIVTLALKTEK